MKKTDTDSNLELAFRRIEKALTSALGGMQTHTPHLHPRKAKDYLERLDAMEQALGVLREQVHQHMQDTGQREE